jgi:transposase-like protein
MATRKRSVHSAAFEAEVAMAASRGERTSSQLASQFGVHPVQTGRWKRRLVEQAVGRGHAEPPRSRHHTGQFFPLRDEFVQAADRLPERARQDNASPNIIAHTAHTVWRAAVGQWTV